MTIDSPHKDFSLAPSARGPGAWLETLLITGITIGLAWWFSPHDPLQVYGFPWSLLAPLLIGLRYGFVKALASAVILVGSVVVMHRHGSPLYAELPSAYIVGTLIVAMLVGEFRDRWERRLQKLQMANEYRQYRLDEFTRAHQILRVSHDRLEQRVAGGDQSLRSSLLLLREQLGQLERRGDALESMADAVIGLLGQYGSLRVAGLYRMLDDQRVEPKPLSTLGEMALLDPDDQLVRLCIDQRKLVSVREMFIEGGEWKGFTSLQACVPLIDAEGRLLALLAIRQMPFFAFNDRTLSLLALLAGHVADLLNSDPASLRLDDADAQFFSQQLKRSLIDVEQHQLSATLFAVELRTPNEELVRVLVDSQRGLDLQLRVINRHGHQCMLILMPLTSAQGIGGYTTRLQYLLGERFGQERRLEDFDLRTLHYELVPTGERQGLRNFLYNECGLNASQVAV